MGYVDFYSQEDLLLKERKAACRSLITMFLHTYRTYHNLSGTKRMLSLRCNELCVYMRERDREREGGGI